MSKQIENLNKGLGQINTAISALITLCSIALFYLNPFALTTLFKVLILLFSLVVAAYFFAKSVQGERLIHFAKEARIELRKVVWPTREETVKTTGMVVIAVIVVAIFLWIVDAFFTWGVKVISNIF